MVKAHKKLSKTKAKRPSETQELDGVFVLKIVMYLIVGAQWIRFVDPKGISQVPVPIGLIVGILFAVHDHFRIDRKIEYTVLLVATFVGFWTQIGIYITI